MDNIIEYIVVGRAILDIYNSTDDEIREIKSTMSDDRKKVNKELIRKLNILLED